MLLKLPLGGLTGNRCAAGLGVLRGLTKKSQASGERGNETSHAIEALDIGRP